MSDSDKTARLTCRATPNERLVVEIMAGRENLDLSEILRVLIREGAERRGLRNMGLVNFIPLREISNRGQ